MKKHLNFYYLWASTGRMPWHGLCNNGVDKRLLKLFKPRGADEFQDAISIDYWAADEIYFNYDRFYGFGPTRQNIVLLIAAMKGEL